MSDTPSRGVRFSVLNRAMKKQVDEYISSEGLTGVQMFVLGALRRLELSETREINQRDLENISHVSHPTMTDILKRLEKKGYVICRRSEQDRRYKCISSADKALGLSRRLADADDLAFDNLCRGLSPEQVEQLICITDVMVENALKYIGKGCECISDKKTCAESEGI